MLDIAEEIKIVEVINSVKEATALINVQRLHAPLVLTVIVDNAKLIWMFVQLTPLTVLPFVRIQDPMKEHALFYTTLLSLLLTIVVSRRMDLDIISWEAVKLVKILKLITTSMLHAMKFHLYATPTRNV